MENNTSHISPESAGPENNSSDYDAKIAMCKEAMVFVVRPLLLMKMKAFWLKVLFLAIILTKLHLENNPFFSLSTWFNEEVISWCILAVLAYSTERVAGEAARRISDLEVSAPEYVSSAIKSFRMYAIFLGIIIGRKFLDVLWAGSPAFAILSAIATGLWGMYFFGLRNSSMIYYWCLDNDRRKHFKYPCIINGTYSLKLYYFIILAATFYFAGEGFRIDIR